MVFHNAVFSLPKLKSNFFILCNEVEQNTEAFFYMIIHSITEEINESRYKQTRAVQLMYYYAWKTGMYRYQNFDQY